MFGRHWGEGAALSFADTSELAAIVARRFPP
jgi:hypothetical protein